jgi:two-component system cell cycle sensor histidine kinase/response regulator CckA
VPTKPKTAVPAAGKPSPAINGGRALKTVRVPEAFRPLFEQAQEYVSRYFRDRVEDPEKSTISISGERYILVRAASMSVEFFDLVKSLYRDRGEDEARQVASNILFDVAHAIGKGDARNFHSKMEVSDPIAKLSAGPVHFSYAGWAFVDILPESAPSTDEHYYLVYDHPFSFEADAWLRYGRRSEFPVCIMNAGYSSGWCEESFGLPLVAVELECQAMGHDHCRFIMAPPARIEEHIRNYCAAQGEAAPVRNAPTGMVTVPEFFQRKRMEEELRSLNAELEHRVEERTAQLTSAYAQLQKQVSQRERMEKLQHALLRIANLASSEQDLEQLYAEIHATVAELMYAKNLYIAQIDPVTGLVSFPYHVDEKDPRPAPRKGGRALTEYVLRTGKPLLATPEKLRDLEASGEIQRHGTHSMDWMGVPLKKDDETFGALVVQSYRENVRYGPAEEQVLTFVSQQIARAIEHKRSAEAIRESEAKFRALAESAVPAIYIFDGNQFLYVNPSCERIFGYTKDELLALDSPWILVHPDDREMVRQRALSRITGTDTPARYEFKAITKDGDVRWMDLSASSILFEGRSAVVATAVDITERKRAEQLQSALYRIADRATSVGDLPTLYKAIHGIVSELMYANNFFIALYDPATDALNFTYAVDEIDEFPPPEVAQPVGKTLSGYVIRTGRPLLVNPQQFKAMIAEGVVDLVGEMCVDWMGAPLKKGAEVFGVLVVQTYSEKYRYTERDREILTFVSQQVASAIDSKRSQEALRQSEEQYRELFENANDMLVTVDLEARIASVNRTGLRMMGYTLEEVRGRKVYEMLDPASRQRSQEMLEAKLRGSSLTTVYEAELLTRSGARLPVEIATRLIYKDGRPIGAQGICRDMTERRALEERLRQGQKMEAVGRLAGGVAHDFNNLLTVIQGYSEILINGLDPGDSKYHEAQEINRAAERAAALTSQLLTFSRQKVLAPKVIDLNEVVANMDKLLQRLVGEDIDFVTVLASHLGRIQADASQIEQVIMNLVVNARDALTRGGRLTIETANADLPQESHGVPEGAYVVLRVSDTGVGMDEYTKSRIFEPFFTTKEAGKGTGLGLSTVYGIVQQSDGFIHVESAPQSGTTFHVYFPRLIGPEKEEMKSKDMGHSPQSGNETILLVEDEDGVRGLVKLVLKSKGYHVLEAADGEEAERVCREYQGKIHLLLTDVVLKQISGRELAQRLMALRPEMRPIYMSGYTDDQVVHRGVQARDTAFLQKPFTNQELAAKVREVLDQP